MSVKKYFFTFLYIFAIATISNALEDTTQSAVPLQNTTATSQAATNRTTTPKPKVNVLTSDLCKKCTCDKDNKQLDCSNKKMTGLFNDNEWNTLQYGDLTFDTIKLEHNNVTVIPILHTYPVKNLYLGFNQIVNITLGAFQNLTELSKLDLSHNKITSKVLVPDVFKGQYSAQDYLPLGNMLELDLGYNELHNLDADLFEHLPKLEILILCKNTFQVIDHLTETAIAGLTSLKTLDMSYMELKDLPDNFLHGPRDLETLILTGNLLDELPDNIELAINLKTFVLDENPVGDFIGENIFPNLRSLEYLSISYLPELQTIGNGAFSNLQNLTTLVASNNPKLTNIDKNAFAKNTTNPLIFDYPPLKQLYLHNNNLSTLERELVQRWDKIDTIDLRYNAWICDCSNSWLIHTLMTQINSTSPLLTLNVMCSEPQAWKDTLLMKLNSEQKLLICLNDNHPERDSLILVGLLVGLLLGIPLTLASIIAYRRGCFGLLNRGNNNGNRSLYNRASFTDDFHI